MAAQSAELNDTETMIRLTQSRVYRAFGFGTEPIDFAKRLISLRKKAPAMGKLLFDIADRVVFTDFLRFEIGWRVEGTRNTGDSFRLGDNLDAIETYLLCTCIDTLAGGREEVTFANWIRANPQQVQEALSGRDSITAQQYAKVTEILFGAYKDTRLGLTRNFLGFFTSLPSFLKSVIADTFILIEGAYLSTDGQERLKRWRELSEEEKIQKIAIDYLYGVRRSRYTHASQVQEAALPGHWRRLVERGALSSRSFSEGWQHTYLRSAKDPSKIRYTLFTRGSRDENYILRATITIHVLTKILEYSVNEYYLERLLAHYRSISSIYAFLHEMVVNRECLDYLTSVQAVTSDNNYHYYGLPTLSTSCGEILLRDFKDVVGILARDIGSYLHWARELNKQIGEFNVTLDQDKNSNWLGQQRALAKFSQALSMSHESGQLYQCHRWVYSNLKRHIESGQVHYRYSGIIAGQ